MHAQITFTAESGVAFNGYNDVRYFNEDNNRGDFFSLTDDFEVEKPRPYIRAELRWQFLDKNIIELTAAPLSFNYVKLNRTNLQFGNRIYTADGTRARYEFNTYRLSYRYEFLQTDNWQIGAGLSVLIRDARIALSQNGNTEETTDLGFVPLVSFHVNYLSSDKLDFVLKGDALVGPVGRAEDIFLGIRYQLFKENLKLRTGYRIIEGGADATEVYNFSLIHFAAVGLQYQF